MVPEGLKVKKGRGRKPLLDDSDLSFISIKLESNSSITIEELRLVLKEELGKEVGKTCCHKAMKECGYSWLEKSIIILTRKGKKSLKKTELKIGFPGDQ